MPRFRLWSGEYAWSAANSASPRIGTPSDSAFAYLRALSTKGGYDALVADIVGTGDSGPADVIDAPPALVVIHAAYDGDDLAHVADMLGCSVEGLANAHQAQRWRVAMMGFAPGFGYLVPEGPMTLPWSELQRRATPRSRVPAGSIAVAGGMSAVYPAPLPGGWHLIGTTVQRMFDLDRRTPPGTGLDPSLLHTGDEVAFRQVPA